jgi:transposase
MNFKLGTTREQMSMFSLDCLIAKDNAVRLIDLFVDQLDLEKLGFGKTIAKQEGCPPYQAKDLLKLYYYGYIGGIRSSRKLESECERNVEVWWLIRQLRPGYHTIADFRKNNPVALKGAFKLFVSFLKGQDMLSSELVAIDGTKLRAQNNRRNNYNESKLARHLAYIENKTQEYICQLEASDAAEDKQAAALKKKVVIQKLTILKERKKKYETLKDALIKSGDAQISTTDVESRSLPLKENVTNICYNIQSVGDSKHSLIIEFETINEGDQSQLSAMACKAKQTLEVEQIIALADKGYHTGKQLQACEREHITAIVAYPEGSNRTKHTDPAYYTEKFMYDANNDCYTCPQGAKLISNGIEFERKHAGRATFLVKKYITPQCKRCMVKHLCAYSTKGKRIIERSTYQDAIDANNKRVDQNTELYKKRQQIIEHPYGTIKRSWGYSYTLLKSIAKVNGEMALIFTMYNFRRAISILGATEMLNRLKKWKPVSFYPTRGPLKTFYQSQLVEIYLTA